MSVIIDHSSILQWGERDGVLHHVDAVKNGVDCNCICSHCGHTLVAKNGGSKKVHHFAHSSGVECAKAVESAVHKLAKQVFANTLRLLLPACEGYGPYGPKDYILETEVAFDRVETEVNIEVDGNVLRPDAIGYLQGKRIFVEFCFTHSVPDEKKELIVKSNTSCLEIFLDLSLQELGKMEAFLHHSPDSKQWIFHRALERLIQAHYERDKEKLKARTKRQAERDQNRRLKEEAKRKAELEAQRKEEESRRLKEIRRQNKLEAERRKKERELAEAETKGNLYKHCPIVHHFLEKFYNTSWGQNEIINSLRRGIWFQNKIFYYWPDNEIDLFVNEQRHIIVPKKEDYDKLSEEQRLYHDYLLESVQKYAKLFRGSINHCSYCNMFVGTVHEFIICKYNIGDDVAGCLKYDEI